MAKSIAKPTPAKAAPKKVAAKATKVTAKPKSTDLEKVSKSILSKLKSLDLDHQLQSDIVWCLGSYSHDKNPIGLIETAERAANVLKTELARKAKGITPKFIADIEAAIK
jgi:hypothetical protein